MLAVSGGLAVGGLGANYLALPCVRIAQVRALRRQMMRDRLLMLTYDDGPSKSFTPLILDVLACGKARATFFSVGARASESPELMDRIHAGGHEIGWHSRNHFHPWKTWPWKTPLDCDAGFNAVSPWLPKEPSFRPPYGKLTLATYLVVRRRNAHVTWWTIDSGDTQPRIPNPKQVAERLSREGGGVVLMHDFERSAQRANYVLATTELLLSVAKREGLRCVVAGELLHSRNGGGQAGRSAR